MNGQINSPANGPNASVTELGDRAVAGWEIASVASSVAIAEWMLASTAGYSKAIIAIPVVLATVVMLVSHRVRRESLHSIGFRFDNFVQALYLLALPVIVVGVLCLAVGWMLGTQINFSRWFSKRNVLAHISFSFGWALAQQYVLQGFFNRRAMLATGRGWPSVLIVAAIFGLLHLPNPWFVLITFVGGGVWAAVYQRAPNLFALAATHTIMTWFIVSTLPASVLRHLRVGVGYLN